jgi:hypothetical protein
MRSIVQRIERPLSDKDRLILALAAQLKAERETRDALAAVVASGQLDRDVLEAILIDPVPAISREDLAMSKQVVASLSTTH